MNIFATHEDPRISGLWLDDIRKNKMILESAQLLSAAMRLKENKTLPDFIYKITHQNHPSSLWTRASSSHFLWVANHAHAMIQQRGKEHKCQSVVTFALQWGVDRQRLFNDSEFKGLLNTAAYKARGVDFTSVQPTTEAYRQYLSYRWSNDTIKLSWDHGEKPFWYRGKDLENKELT